MVICSVMDRSQFNRTLDSFSSLTLNARPFEGSANSHGIKSFADPHPLNLYAATLYKNSGAGVLGSGVGTRHSSLAIALKFFLFTFLRTLWHDAKLNSFLFKRLRTLYPKTPGVGGGDRQSLPKLSRSQHNELCNCESQRRSQEHIRGEMRLSGHPGKTDRTGHAVRHPRC